MTPSPIIAAVVSLVIDRSDKVDREKRGKQERRTMPRVLARIAAEIDVWRTSSVCGMKIKENY